MISTRELVLSKIKELRAERAQTRILRSKQKSEERNSNSFSLPILNSYLESPDPPRPIYITPVTPTLYSDPPPTPEVKRDPKNLRALSILYPIGQTTQPYGQWFIVSPEFYIDAACEFKQEWNENVQRITAVFTYSANLLIMISKVLRRDLPYKISIEKGKILISNSTSSYDLLSMSHQREFFIALKLLNSDANFFGNKGQNLLLPNLQAALQLNNPSENQTAIQSQSKPLG